MRMSFGCRIRPERRHPKVNRLFRFTAPALLLGLAVAAVAQTAPKPGPKDPVVELNTSRGAIRIQLYNSLAPKTAGNFLDLVKRGFYKNMIFHRVEPGFVVQGGDPLGNGTGGFVDPKTGKERTIPLETTPKLKHDAAGVVAMARSQDPNSASSQFYITLAPAEFLDGNYAVFGRVISGMEAVRAINPDYSREA
jgi:cyclophilin family peptidyl-prolyl cis-trans isomerase